MEWIEVPIPISLASGPLPQIIHYLKVNDDWSVYIVEIDSKDDSGAGFAGPAGQPIPGRAKWMIICEGSEIGSGVLKNLKSAKNVSMIVLTTLMDCPNPDGVKGSDVIIRRRGSEN